MMTTPGFAYQICADCGAACAFRVWPPEIDPHPRCNTCHLKFHACDLKEMTRGESL